ncbi:AzlC family ABC transporter permease [Spongisporangium articulatum]|uniref:AzlC family ABC transporter permease n=1 Tax=Spongisporangium articulatum TaxID=3362603 RepID=A0ABW8ANH2_9ACTN
MTRGTQDPARAAAVRQALSVGLAVGAYGVSFGALGAASGLSVAQTCVLSLLMFSGGSQFALAGIVGAGGSGLSAVATAGLLGVRNGLYGLQVGPLLRGAPAPTGWRRPLKPVRDLVGVQLTIDETTAVATGQQAVQPDRPDVARVGFWVTGVTVFSLWNATTLAGALLGTAAGDPRRFGLDAAAAAAFLALLWPRLRELSARRAALVAALVAAVAVPFVPAGVPVLIAAVAALGMAVLV